ncbi:hypothetical protein B0H12DRAFT_1247040, partial [Mycena haematopus]
MARTKNPKPKEMFKPYNEADVPDRMPFPDLARVAATKGDETAVPKLNQFQRRWILDVAIRGVDLANLTGKDAIALYERVKDRDEEGRLPSLIATWKQNQRAKQNSKSTDDDDDSDNDNDNVEREDLLRGYRKTGWRIAIQKVISNKRTAERSKSKTKATKKDDASASTAEAPALAKLFGLAAYTGRDKFRDDRHQEIHEHSRTLAGDMNAGGKFRKAEALLWAKEDQAAWEAAATADENVDWA